MRIFDDGSRSVPTCRILWLALGVVLGTLIAGDARADESRTACLIMTGLGGVPEYEENFVSWADSLEEICTRAEAEIYRLDGREERREAFLATFESLSQRDWEEVWVFLVGHGSHDGRLYKFNIRGPDLTEVDLRDAFAVLDAAKLYAVLSSSSSGALLDPLQAPGRVIVSATKSVRERHPPLFMSFFIEAAESAEADVNKDRRVSLQEVFEFSRAKVEEWYQEKNLLQTEHPVLAEGSEASSLAVAASLSAPSEQAYRTLEARSLVPERTRLEREIEALKLRKPEMAADDYYQQLQRLLVELAELNQRIEELESGS